MEDSQSDPKIFSTRIVAMDYYMAAPILDVDFCYSNFQGGKVNEVPVIRIYGTTPAGQKTCLHIHKALPYLYIPCTDLQSQPDQEGSAFTQAICLAIEQALKLKGNAGSKRQHVHSCTLVRAKKFYGYHSYEELFMKIHLFHPQDLSRVSNLLLGGVILDKVLQPYESHIPFLLQFLIDYNLYGMGHIHLSKIKFRHPVPEAYNPKSVFYNAAQGKANLVGDQCSTLPIWTSGTLPDDWMWPSWSHSEAPSGRDRSLVKRQSNSELEGDAVVEGILNQLQISYELLSQNSSEVRMVQSLVPIWEEERERSGIRGPDVSRNSGKPPPEDVLRMLSHWHDLENTLLEKFGVITPDSSAEECIEGLSKDQTAQRQQSSADQVQIFGSVGPSNVQAFDQDALGILKWLASSQAVEEINSDDELAHETILSPLLPATTMAKVLEKANTDFECLSQQECQDILDSVEDSFNEVGPCRGVSFSDDNEVSLDSSSNKIIPQVDGSGDKSFTSDGNPTFKLNSEPEMSECDDSACGHLSLASRSKRKLRRWGSLPVSVSANLNFSVLDSSNVIDMYNSEKIVQENAEAVISSPLVRNGNYDHVNTEASLLSESSMRELRRKKRCYRTELPGCSLSEIRQVLSEEEPKKDDIHYGDLRNDEVINRPLASVMSTLNPTDKRVADSGNSICPSIENSLVSKVGQCKSDFSLHGRSPVSFGSRFGLLSNVTTQRWPAPAESLKFRTDSNCKHISGFQDTTYGSSELVRECKPASKYAALDNHNSAMCIMYDGSSNHQSEVSHGKEIMFADPVISKCHTPFLLLGENSKMIGSTIKFPCQTEISLQEIHDISDDNPKYTKVLEGSRNFPTTIQIDNNHEMSILHPGIESSKGSRGSNLKVDSSGLVGMTLCLKPPVIKFTGGFLSSVALSPSITHGPPLTKGRGEGSFIQPEKMDGLAPFFTRDRLTGNEPKSVCCSREDYLERSNNHGIMGVPMHYQNDGSRLYILAPLLSPPSCESVKIWLLDRGTTSGISRESASVSSTSLQNLSVNLVDSEVLELTSSGFSLSESTQHNQDTHIEDLELRQNVVTVIQHKEANCFKSKAYFSQGTSQLSGPDSKSKLTPLSQIGFRDPASIGGTQQLTILSIEVQAESRDDLRPNPEFDAINIIALVVQADDDPTSEAIILLRSNKESSRVNLDGIRDCKVLVFQEEKLLFNHFVMVVSSFDPDMLMGWDVQGGSLGFLAERAAFLGIALLKKVSRTRSLENVGSREFNASEKDTNLLTEGVAANSVPLGDAVIEDEWGRTHASGVHVGGRIVLNIWRLMRNEVKLNMYTVEAVAEAVLRRKIPFISSSVLTKWFTSGPGCARHRCIEYILERAKLNIRIMDQLDMVNRTSELARVFGIDFFSVLSRGSQYRVESMFLRLAHTQNYLAISPGSQQVAYQPAMECLPLVMEPESGFYVDPVVVLDFQSLYPSMIIAYNLCYSTCLGKILPSKENNLGVSSYSPDRDALQRLKEEISVTPNGVMYVPSKVRKGILPRLLEEILSTRIMIKQAMKKLDPSQQVLHRIFNARQLALKLIANVTYGYTAAGFSGRMPCAELADSIVQCGRRTLEQSISFVSNHASWKAKVVYGDTDSMFVLLKGRSLKEAFKIGSEIAAAITAMNPDPVVLKMEKVYHPCFLLTKKRYAGYSYECPDQMKPKFDAKGIETVRRDTCVAVSKTMEQSLRLFFEHKDIDKVKSYLLRQWRRIMSGRISLQDFVFAKEVRLGTYSGRANTLPPGAIIATKAMKADPRAEPRYAERIPYVVVHGEPGARLVDMVVDPLDILAIDSPFRLNDVYYIKKQIIPALQRVFGLVGADLNKWYSKLPRPERGSLSKRHLFASNSHRTRIDFYYMSRHCILCRALVNASSYLCRNCSVCEATLAIVMTGRTAKLEKDIQHLVAMCRHCGGGDWLLESGVKCTSLACTLFYERRKVQKELRSISAVATETGIYPTCMAELF